MTRSNLRRLKRAVRFVRSLRTRHNVRALWTQSDPDWREKLPVIDISDEEFDLFLCGTGHCPHDPCDHLASER